MEANILEDRLKQAMALVNKETMVVDPDVLESRAGALFRDVGADELLVTLSNLKLADGNYVRENLGTFVEKQLCPREPGNLCGKAQKRRWTS